MDGTPRLRSAFPATPPRNPRDRRNLFARPSPSLQRDPLPQVPTSKAQQPTQQASQPVIPEHIIDAPSQRLYAVAFWAALWTWRIYDFTGLQESEEQSLWLFMKWVAIDGIFLFGLPGMRIPWLEWSSATMTLIFLAHAVVDGMLMFRIPIPIAAGLAVLWRGVVGSYETAVNEYNVNPDSVLLNESLILGRQIIHILPEGSAVLNPNRKGFCLDQYNTEARLPITINATNPISMDILRVDLETRANETLHVSKSQIKSMHKDASRLYSYSDKPNEPKTLYYPVKKPGLYALAKVVDESNLEVSRKQLAHTVVVPCPQAAIVPSASDMCRGDHSNVRLEVTGTPPMKVKYRKIVNKNVLDATFENIQPEDIISPLVRQDQGSLMIPNKVEIEWAKTRTVPVPLSEGLSVAGRWVYAIDEITDGFGNAVTYGGRGTEQKDSQSKRSPHLNHIITVHERPNVQLNGCTPQQPLKVAKGQRARLPVKYGSTAHKELVETEYHLEYLFSPQNELAVTGEHGAQPARKSISVKDSRQLPLIDEPGLYTLTGVRTDFCKGDVLEPASCLLQNPPEPALSIKKEEIFDKCAGSPIGLRVDLDLAGTPPFKVKYRTKGDGNRHHKDDDEIVQGFRGQMTFQPREAGRYRYEFLSVSDAIYPDRLLTGLVLDQSVKPSASATFISRHKQVSCIDQRASAQIALVGEDPFTLEYELVHNNKRARSTLQNVTKPTITLETEPLTEGGDYTLTLTSITDAMGCKEWLKDEAKIAVRHQKPKVAFGLIDGRRTVETLENKAIDLPLRLAGEAPWTVKYRDETGEQSLRVSNANDLIAVKQQGMYELVDVHDNACPGIVDETAKDFQVSWIPRPELRIPEQEVKDRKGNTLIREDVCEGDEDAIEVLFRGTAPFELTYVQSAKLDHGAVSPKDRMLGPAAKVASLRMETSQSGLHEYKLSKLKDGNYEHSAGHFSPITIKQRVHPRPSAKFDQAGKTYSFCSVESTGEEVIPVTLHGAPPFELEVEIKHHGSMKPELVHYPNIPSHSHHIRIPHSRLHLGKSAVSLRRVGDSRGCARTLDSTTPRVQIAVHDAPTITPLDSQADYCVGDRLNFGLSGVAPFTIFYTFEGVSRKATVSSGSTFRRLAEKPGTFNITGLQDSASSCVAGTSITKHIHGMPSVRVSKGKDSYVDIHEGGQAEIHFDFGGTPPFEFTYTRSSNTEKGGRKPGVVLDMRSEVSDEHSMRIWASEEGTYEVVAIKDKHCSYMKPGVKGLKVEKDERKRLTY